MEFFKKLFETDFMPHGHCYFWKPAVLWTNVLGDAVIALSYFIIPFLLVRFLKKRSDVRFRGLFMAFAAFILACGTTHLIDIISVWHPMYRLEGLVKVITAIVSGGTVMGLFYYFPTVLSLPTPEQWSYAKEEAKRSENRFKTLMDQAPVGVAVTSAKGEFLEVNGTICHMFKYSEAELKKLTFVEVTHPDDMNLSIAAKDSLALGAKNFIQFEKRYLRSDGSYFWAMVSATAMPEEKLNLVHIMDITERKHSEQRVQDDNRLLESKVEERTKALAEINKDLENFIYAITHDLRVPLHNLSGLTAALKEELSEINDESEAKNILSMIGQNAEKMDELVVDLLAFSKTGQQELTKVKVDMNALVNEVLEELKTAYPDKKTELEVAGLPEGYGDHAAFRQVWFNLLSNAFKYSSKKDTIRIEVSGWQDARHTHYKVKDYGEGYDARYAEKLFNLFQRLHNPEDYEGSGIGLATCLRLVKKHGGTMWSESVLNEGATFYFSVPR